LYGSHVESYESLVQHFSEVTDTIAIPFNVYLSRPQTESFVELQKFFDTTYYYAVTSLKDNIESSLSDVQQSTSLKVVSLSGGRDNVIALKSDGTVWTWGHLMDWDGHSNSGLVFPVSPLDSVSPKAVPSLASIMKITAGSSHFLALMSDGTLWAWGDNSEGQLGDGTTSSRTAPVKVSIADVIDISASGTNTIALKRDGTVWVWGADASIDAIAGSASSPIKVSSLSNVVSVNASGNGAFVVKSDGTLWAWGFNANGRLGDGTNIDRTTPVQVVGLHNIVSFYDTGFTVYAVRADGSVYSWGYGAIGSVSDNSTVVSRYIPGLITGLSGVAKVSVASYPVFIKNDMSVWTFTSDGNSKFVQVASYNDAIMSISLDGANIVLKSSGSLSGWGDNNYSILGSQGSATYTNPTAISGI